MKFFVICPANIATGGTELLHQLCHYLTQYGVENYMVYVGVTGAFPTPERFLKYNVKYVTEYVDASDTVLVIPETVVEAITWVNKGIAMLWWLSVDNYVTKYNAIGDNIDVYGLKNMTNVIHFVQSYYAKDFLNNKLGIHECFFLQDYINDDIVEVGSNSIGKYVRKKQVLYNPKKGFDKLVGLIEKCRKDIVWIPIINMTPVEIADLMLQSMVYIDFGSHPGKDRIPREAAVCGCCIITNTEGSAAFDEDVAIPKTYKCHSTDSEKEVLNKIYELVDNYDSKFNEYDDYRKKIVLEKAEFEKQVLELISILMSRMCYEKESFNAGIYSSMMVSIKRLLLKIIDEIEANDEVNKNDEDKYINKILDMDYYLNITKESLYTVINNIVEK